MCFARPHICDERLFGYSVFLSYPLDGEKFRILFCSSPERDRRDAKYSGNLPGAQKVLL